MEVHGPLGRLVVELIGQHLHYRPLVRRQVLGHRYSELDLEVARAAAPAQLGHALAAQRHLVARVGARRDLDPGVALERRDHHLAAEDGRRERQARRVEDVGPLALELGIRRHLDEHEQVARHGPRVGGRGPARRRGVALAHDSQLHAVLDSRGDVHRQRLALPRHAVALAGPALGAAGDRRPAAAAGVARARHLEPAHDRVDPRSAAAARLAGRSLGALLQPAARARLARHQRHDVDRLGRALGRIHERDVGLHLDVLALKDLLLLERVATAAAAAATTKASPPAGKRREEVIEVDVGAESALGAAEAVEAAAAAAKGMTAAGARGLAVGVEAGGAELVELLALLGIREDLVGRLDLGELVLGIGVLVGVGMVLFSQSVVGLLDVGGRGALADSEGAVGIPWRREKSAGGVESLREEGRRAPSASVPSETPRKPKPEWSPGRPSFRIGQSFSSSYL